MKAVQLTALIASAAFAVSSVSGQILSISATNQPVTLDFGDFEGTVDTLPDSVSFSNSPGEGGYFNFDDSPSLTPNNLYAFRDSASDPVFGFVYKRPAGSPASIFVNVTAINDTGRTINEFKLSFDFIQASIGGRATEIWINWNPGPSFTSNGITGGEDYVAQAEDTTSISLLDPYQTQNRSISYSSASGIADGETVVFGFNIRTGDGSGNNAHVGFSNVEITAIPEPSTYAALFGALAFGLVVFLRRRRR
ncbi:MAG: PEP-CTERM sorting domain-containing protein [Opitutales bacterium]|nr:PEP-CTERM sorting domain-containing protein [Opitutales bacterium]